ncbi:MAG: DUF2029 domain-containing protein [Candidatus Omnitrophica bacterium]|nr:DUF2029 domain-containing protein [Candidatus Omnitrophota bacterium]MCM8793288.1 DUF2029 domain-containing protein [Candidatus Omnitrophota bacterium]
MEFPRTWKIFLVIILFVIFFLQYQQRAPKRNFSDFHMLYHTAKRFLYREPIYTFVGEIAYYKYTPFYAFLISFLAKFSERTAASIWFLANILFFLFLVYALKELIIEDKDKFKAYTLFYFLSIISCLRFIIGNFHQGQSNILMMCLLLGGLFFLEKNRENLASFFIAFSIMVKYMTLLFLPWLLLRRKFSLLIKVLIFILIFNLIPALSWGWKANGELLKQGIAFLFKSSLDNYSLTCYPNQSLLACLNRFFSRESFYKVNIFYLPQEKVNFIFAVLAILLYSLAIIPGRKIAYDFSLISICVAFFNPNAWRYFYIWLLPAYMSLFYYLIKDKFKEKWILILVAISFIFCSLPSEEIMGEKLSDILEIYSFVTLGALFLFLTLLRLKFLEVRPPNIIDFN